MTLAPRIIRCALIGLAALTLADCAGSGPRPGPAGRSAAGGYVPAALQRADVLWLERVGFGVDSRELAAYRRFGRAQFLQQQLEAQQDDLPPAVAERIAALPVSQLDAARTLAAVRAQRRAIRTLGDTAARQQARRALNRQGNQLAAEAATRELLRAIYSSSQLREQMVWFWLNHFSVSEYKGDLRWLLGDYAEHAIRPHALGHFRDLVMATLEHPAMLEYLDNWQNRAGHLNENYAREFMELHTLGVGSGYTQQDVQQLARVFTGVGINVGAAPRLPPALQRLYVRRGAFEFNPAHHDFGAKVLLGHRLQGRGFAEVQNAVTLIVRQPACARFISRELATYFVADDPPPRLVAAMSATFRRTDGDIGAVLRTLFTSPEFNAALGGKFKDPMRYVVSAMRLTYDDEPAISNVRPVLGWLGALGEAPYGRQTPDGYPLTASGWASPGQVSRRFEIARAIGNGAAPLLGVREVPQLSSELYEQTLAPFLAPNTRAALAQARSAREWNTFLLSSPELNYE